MASGAGNDVRVWRKINGGLFILQDPTKFPADCLSEPWSHHRSLHLKQTSIHSRPIWASTMHWYSPGDGTEHLIVSYKHHAIWYATVNLAISKLNNLFLAYGMLTLLLLFGRLAPPSCCKFSVRPRLRLSTDTFACRGPTALSHDSKFLAVARRYIYQVYDVESGMVTRTFKHRFGSSVHELQVAFAHGDTAFLGVYDDGALRLWDLVKQTKMQTLRCGMYF